MSDAGPSLPPVPKLPWQRRLWAWVRRQLPFALPVGAFYTVAGYTFLGLDHRFQVLGIILLPMGGAALAVLLTDPYGKAGVDEHLFLGTKLTGWILLLGLLTDPGFMCILLAWPMVLAFASIGAVVAGQLLRLRRRTLPSLLILLPVLAYPVEPSLDYPVAAPAVTTVIDIAASPETVWRLTLDVRDIRAAERAWTVSHGLIGTPGPVEARLEGSGVGAIRHVRWERGVHFEEHITEWEPGRALGWRFAFAPDSIPKSVEGHMRLDSDYLRIERGGYRLDAMPGGTRLTLTTHYRIATPYNAYAEWWGEFFIQDFHKAVLAVIRSRAEAAQTITASAE